MTTSAPTHAFLGATGGVTNAALVNALRNNADCIALVRTPSKLREQLIAQSLSEAQLSSHLTILEGNALTVADVKSLLKANKPGHLVSYITTGLGGTPNLTFNASNPLQIVKIDNPTICTDGASTLVAALLEIYSENPQLETQKPKLTYVATTGISQPRGPEDVPFGMQTMYHQVLAVPHQDKRDMDAIFRNNYEGTDGRKSVFAGIIGIRPTLLSGEVDADSGKGLESVKAGTEQQPAKGWMIARADVGNWIWVNALQKDGREKWEEEMVSLTS